MRVSLVRHGPTHARGLIGWSDVPADLSDRKALARLDEFLCPDGVVVSSDLRRATATADAIAGKRMRLPHEAALREIHFGAWEGQVHSQIADQKRLRAFLETPGACHAPGGESWHQFTARVHGVIDRLIAAHRGRDLHIVAHFGVVLAQLQRALALDAQTAMAYRIDPLSITQLVFTTAGWRCAYINHCP